MGCRDVVSAVVVCEVGLTVVWSDARVWCGDVELLERLYADRTEGCSSMECE